MGTTIVTAIGIVVGLIAGLIVVRARRSGVPGDDRDAVRRLREESGLRAAADARAEQVPVLEARVRDLQDQNGTLREEIARAAAAREAEHAQLERERTFLAEAEARMLAAFETTSSKALKTSQTQFLELAKSSFEQQRKHMGENIEARQQAIEQLVKPMRDSLANVDQQFRAIEAKRIATHQDMLTQVQRLEVTTSTLASALRSPKARGRWGEMQLKRVVEAAGMVEHCDFVQQSSHSSEAGRLQPDMVVRLAGGKSIVVDAKTPMDAYLHAIEATDPDVRALHMAEHVQRIKTHIRELSRKSYADVVEGSPDYVVLFLPGEDLFSAALDVDPTLIEVGTAASVFLATPTSLIMMLRSALHGWREEALATSAREISSLGRDLYERLAVLGEHWAKVGKGLTNAVRSYNESVGSLETRVLPAARRFRELGVASSKEIPESVGVELEAKGLVAPELEAGRDRGLAAARDSEQVQDSMELLL